MIFTFYAGLFKLSQKLFIRQGKKFKKEIGFTLRVNDCDFKKHTVKIKSTHNLYKNIKKLELILFNSNFFYF